MIEAQVTQHIRQVVAAVTASGISAAVTTTTPVVSVSVDNGRKGDAGADGIDGHSPVLTWSGDQIAIDGVVSGPHLTGPQGAQGPAGIDGEDGAAGAPGADGHTPVFTWSGDQIAVDGVVAGPHLTGPQGPQGAQGSAGATGSAGEDGANGADGHSPVLTWQGDQIAVDGVVSGPHLTGPQGLQGVQGVQGVQGPVGATGATGPAGADGAAVVGDRVCCMTTPDGVETIFFLQHSSTSMLKGICLDA